MTAKFSVTSFFKGDPVAKAEEYEQKGQPQKAAEIYRKAKQPERAALLYAACGEVDKAVEVYRALVPLAMQLDEVKEAI
ncbi:MAG: hypothetical protein HC897_06090, partial [Thermoanaerobaculia bacterium]|nr:hypothetical protein [Thermoanaerobaculia bacterium]